MLSNITFSFHVSRLVIEISTNRIASGQLWWEGIGWGEGCSHQPLWDGLPAAWVNQHTSECQAMECLALGCYTLPLFLWLQLRWRLIMIINCRGSCGLLKDREVIVENQFLTSALHISFLLWFPRISRPQEQTPTCRGAQATTAFGNAWSQYCTEASIQGCPSQVKDLTCVREPLKWTTPNSNFNHQPSFWTVSFF